jgi:phage baseplate assembly protein W
LYLEVCVSVEIQAGFPCPHLVVEEPVVLGADRRSLQTRAPVANAPSIRVLVNDQTYVPPNGLYSQALLQARSGPYRIERCTGVLGPDANEITVKSSQGTVTLSLPLGKRIKVADLERALKLTPLNDIVTITTRNNAIAFGDAATTGPQSYVRVSGKGADALGFTQRGARGRELYPGWRLVSRRDVFPTTTPRGLIPVPARYPQFVKPLSGNPNIKVTYAAMPERCPRCEATYVENDYRFNLEGEFITIENENLLYQACLKALLTRKGSNPYHPGYGSSLMSRLGSKQVRATAAALREDVVNCLSRVQSVQNGQRKFQQVKDRERLYRINSVSVRPSADDITTYFVEVSVTNGTGQPVALSIVYSAPGAVALAGSNGQVLGLESTGLTRAQSQRFLLDG